MPAALIASAPTQFNAKPNDLRSALASISDPTEILRRLLDGGNSVVAGRLAGAFRNIGRDEIADRIAGRMKTAGYVVNETDPFSEESPVIFESRETSPYVSRLKLMWVAMRPDILANFPAPPGRPRDAKSYLKKVDDLYAADAYNSLSIEGYRVSAELIARVHTGKWNPDKNEDDQKSRDALAARGYWQDSSVKTSLTSILKGENPGDVVRRDYDTWYGQLFEPSVTAKILTPGDLAGFRNGPVFIRRSMHVRRAAHRSRSSARMR